METLVRKRSYFVTMENLSMSETEPKRTKMAIFHVVLEPAQQVWFAEKLLQAEQAKHDGKDTSGLLKNLYYKILHNAGDRTTRQLVKSVLFPKNKLYSIMASFTDKRTKPKTFEVEAISDDVAFSVVMDKLTAKQKEKLSLLECV